MMDNDIDELALALTFRSRSRGIQELFDAEKPQPVSVVISCIRMQNCILSDLGLARKNCIRMQFFFRSESEQPLGTYRGAPTIDFQAEKNVVRRFYRELDQQDADLQSVLNQHTSNNYIWRGYQPFIWSPLRRAIKSIQRREDVFFAGLNEIDGFNGTWVVSMGHLMGLFDEAWLPAIIHVLRYSTSDATSRLKSVSKRNSCAHGATRPNDTQRLAFRQTTRS